MCNAYATYIQVLSDYSIVTCMFHVGLAVDIPGTTVVFNMVIPHRLDMAPTCCTLLN